MTEQTKNEPPLRVTLLEAVNFMGIRSLEITPGDKTLTQIVGPNASGKTSGLKALVTALSGKRQHPEMPLRTGADKGHVKVELSEDLKPKYRAEWHWEKGKEHGTLKLWSLRGDRERALKNGRTVLDELLGDIGLDPLRFQHANDTDQIAMLMSASDLADFYEESQTARVELYDSRTEINREVKRLASLLDSTPDPSPSEPLEAISDKELAERMEVAQAHNAGRNTLEGAIRTAEANLADWEADVRALKSKITDLHEQIGDCENTLDSRKSQLANLDPPIDAEALQDELTQCREHNEQCQQQAEHYESMNKLAAAESESEDLTKEIATIDNEIVEKLNNSELGQNMPGLRIVDGGVSLNGVPLKQVCGWEGLHISTLVCMAASPRARVLLIDEADRIDDDSMNNLCDLADKHEFQIFMACVRTTLDNDPDTHVCRIDNGTEVEP